MSKDDNDSFEDVDSLIKKIGGVKKQEPEPAPPTTPPTTPLPYSRPNGSGDFSALLKKLGMAGKTGDIPAPVPVEVPEVPPSSDPPQQTPMSLEDLFDDIPENTDPGSPGEPPESAGETRSVSAASNQDPSGTEPAVPGSSTEEKAPAPVFPPPPAEPAELPASPAVEQPVEIIDEDPKAAMRKFPGGKKTPAESTPPPVRESEVDEKIITVDQITNLSGLILPKGATFQVDELRLHGRVNAYEGSGSGTLPPEFDELWKKNFSTAGFKDLDIEMDLFAETPKTKPESGKFSLSALFKAIRPEEEEYDPAKHGPLVDLSFKERPGIEEMELYPVNEPYAYIRITYDHSTHEYTYHVIEPNLTDPEKELLRELKERLFDTLDINTKDISKDEAKKRLRMATTDIIHDYGIKLSPLQQEKIHYNMYKDFLGDGLIDAIMHDKYIEDISCDGVHTPIFAFHSSFESMKTTLSYNAAEELDSFVTKLAQRAGKYISIAEPILDATMQDGSRIQMTLGQEVTAHGSTFTIRKFKDEPITPTDLIEWHTFAPLSIAYIWLAVENGKSAIFAGGTASGKTTALNAISLFIPPMAKVVSLEDTREVKLPHPNWIPSVTRDSFDTAGRGEINMYELLRAAMRQRPEYIIVGEVRGKECQTLFQAMSTGHVTYSTTHADSVASVVHRIENPPMDVPRNMLSALDFICVQVQARVGGKRIRRNKQIVEILDIDPRTNELITNEVFKWRSATDEHTYSGKSYLLEEIMEAKGWNENRMREELKRRQEVLEWMRIKKIRHYKDVAKILISYNRDPEAVIEKVRKDLYE